MRKKKKGCFIKDDLCYIPIGKHGYAVCDKEKIEEVNQYAWYLSVDGRDKYVKCKTKNGKSIRLNRLLCPQYKRAGYANGNFRDNRICNIYELIKNNPPSLNTIKIEESIELKHKRLCFIENHICYVPLANGGFALCDEDRFDEVQKWSWSDNTHGYAISKKNFLHKFLYPEFKEIDHINLNKMDNRSCNLRECSRTQNQGNRTLQKNNKSGFKGVYSRRGKFESHISHNRNRYYLGSFLIAEEAARAYDKKAIELFGEFARLNFPEE